jgi:hypothetical protein
VYSCFALPTELRQPGSVKSRSRTEAARRQKVEKESVAPVT